MRSLPRWKGAELNSLPGVSSKKLPIKHKGARAMIEKRVAQVETDVRILTSLVAKLETEVHAVQQAMQGLEKQVAELNMRVEEMRTISAAVHALS
jgi:outer membrane murein-binding lipoprotein Lpp